MEKAVVNLKVDEIYSRVVRASDSQCRSRNCPGFDPSILRHSGSEGGRWSTVEYRTSKEKNPIQKSSKNASKPVKSTHLRLILGESPDFSSKVWTFIFNCGFVQGPAAVTRTPGAEPSWETGLQVKQTLRKHFCLYIISTGSKKKTNIVFANERYCSQRTCIPRVPQCLSRPNWDLPPTPSPASDSVSPPEPKRGTHSPADEGVGSPNSDDWRKSQALSLLCGTAQCSIAQGA